MCYSHTDVYMYRHCKQWMPKLFNVHISRHLFGVVTHVTLNDNHNKYNLTMQVGKCCTAREFESRCYIAFCYHTQKVMSVSYAIPLELNLILVRKNICLLLIDFSFTQLEYFRQSFWKISSLRDYNLRKDTDIHYSNERAQTHSIVKLIHWLKWHSQLLSQYFFWVYFFSSKPESNSIFQIFSSFSWWFFFVWWIRRSWNH